MDQLDPDDVCRIIGKLHLEHELELRRLNTILSTRIKQLESELENVRRGRESQ